QNYNNRECRRPPADRLEAPIRALPNNWLAVNPAALCLPRLQSQTVNQHARSDNGALPGSMAVHPLRRLTAIKKRTICDPYPL
ncbi:MAG: hypothetical protein ACR2I0_09490, partial [Rhodoferax sp.]